MEIFLQNQQEINGNKVNVREILLVNKKTGLPILSRVYTKTSDNDPVLISGLLTSIIRFAETLGGNFELNDIGVKEGVRIFVRSQHQLACLIIMDGVALSRLDAPKFMEIVDEISSRVFEVILMMFASPFMEPLTPLEVILEISYENYIMETLSNLNEEYLCIYPELGPIIDNIIMESIMIIEAEESIDDMRIETMVESMQRLDSTYADSSYTGVTKKIRVENKEKLKNIVSKIMSGTDEK